MPELAVITPTWRPDAEFFADLHKSVLKYTSDDTVHHVIVPAAHRSHFTRFEGPRCRIWTHPELLPRRYVRLPGGVWGNMAAPWPPVRGWVMQQAAKIAAAAIVEADAVLMADSDVILVRPTTAAKYVVDGKLSLFREKDAISPEMERHVLWHQVARNLLGLPPGPPPPLTDYVGAMIFWDPVVVRAMQERISQVTGRHWVDAFTSQLHISEFIVYGVFADEALGEERRPPESPPACLNYYDRTPLTHETMAGFADHLRPDQTGIMISSHSGTPSDVRLATVRMCEQVGQG
jgi:hypothetical protein